MDARQSTDQSVCAKDFGFGALPVGEGQHWAVNVMTGMEHDFETWLGYLLPIVLSHVCVSMNY